MRWIALPALVLGASLYQAPGRAAEPVVGVPDARPLFRSPNPKLNTNKQAAYHIVRDLYDAGHWEDADKYLTARYLNHNPQATSGRAGVQKFFTEVIKAKRKPVDEKLAGQIVAVTAERDFVTVAYVREQKDPADPTRTYTTTWFDMWRFVGGKADEHWDPQTLTGN